FARHVRQRQEDRERRLPRPQVQPDEHVVEGAATAEHARLLESAHQAERRDLARLQSAQLLPHEGNVARGRRKVAGDRVERGGLAGAVGTDERQHLAFAHLHAHFGDCGQAAEAHREVFDLKNCSHPRIFVKAGTMPRGRKYTTSTMSRPYTIHCASGAIAAARSPSGRRPKISPPTTGPASVPLPPVITMITIVTV